jgi:hypothetical protein
MSGPPAKRPPPVPVPPTIKKPSRQQGAALEIIEDEKGEIFRNGRLRKLVTVQSWIIGGLSVALAVFQPFAEPVNLYYAVNPDQQKMKMVGLSMPNMTNRAVVSWSVTSIVEILTMGFGDMDVTLPRQKVRFTPKGWEIFNKAFVKSHMGETFKQSQLVLTTAPTNTAVIVSQGVNPDQVYQWTVQMPVVMNYATNNDVTQKKHALITLVIVRVPADQSPSGIAIHGWALSTGDSKK